MLPRLPRDVWSDLLSSPYNKHPRERCLRASKECASLLQRMSKLESLDVHRGCVNTIWWDDTGQLLLSGSDDHRLVITEPYTKQVRTQIHTSHRANIFSAKFLPGTNSRKIVSCAGDGNVLFTDLARVTETHTSNFSCHSGTTYELLTVSGDPNSFLSCGEDGTVRWFDLRAKDKCRKSDCKEDVIITCPYAVTSMSMNPMLPYYLAVGSSDSSVRIFDRRMLGNTANRCKAGLVSRFLLDEMEGKKRRITAVDYRPDGQEILASFSSDYIYIFDPNDDDLSKSKKLWVGKRPKGSSSSKSRVRERSPPPMKRLRLRGDWSDTGPNARPETAAAAAAAVAGQQEQQEQQEEQPAANDESANDEPGEAEAPAAGAVGGQPEPDQPRRRDNRGHGNLMQRMTDALSRMLNDPSTRLAMRSLGDRDAGHNNHGHADHGPAVDANLEPEEGETNPFTGESMPVPIRPEEQQPTSQSGDTGDDSTTGGATAIDRSVDTLRSSLSTMREDFLDRHNSEPDVSLRYGGQGVESSMISMQPSTSSTSGPSGSSMGEAAAQTGRRLSDDQSHEEDLAAAGESSQQERGKSREPLSSSTSSMSQRRSSSPGGRSNSILVPGPNQVITHPGASGTNPITGERQRRRGVSGPPSEPLEMSTPQQPTSSTGGNNDSNTESDDDLCEYEVEEEEEEEEEEDDDDDEEKRYIRQPSALQKFSGHRNARTMIKEATWWGNHFVLSGSDCGHIFGWERATGKLVLLLEADRHVVNCVQPHPFDPVLASSGIDYDIKLWAPSGEGNAEPLFDEELARTLTERNEIMLEETRDTITVPATLMIRMLASLNRVHRAGRLIPRVLERRREREEREAAAAAANEANQEDEESQNNESSNQPENNPTEETE